MAFLDFSVEKSKTYDSTNRRIAELLSQINNPRPALTEIGAVVYKTTMNRFVTKRNPGGQSWKRNTPTTLRIKRKGNGIKGRARPGFSLGVWDDVLRRRIFVDVKNNEVTVGTRGVDYAPYFHYGVTKLSSAGGFSDGTSPWGEIPARPFLGITRQDNRDIVNVIKKHLGFK